MNSVSFAQPTFGRQHQPRFAAHYRVLVVDDEPITRTLITTGFQKLERASKGQDTFNLATAHNAQEAITLLDQSGEEPANPFIIVSSDNSMPTRNDGMQVLQHIKNMPSEYKPPHVFMYSSDKDIQEQALELGAKQVYDKTQVNALNLAKTIMTNILASTQTERPTLSPSSRSKSTSALRPTSPFVLD